MPNVFVGIDVAKFKHTFCAISGKGEVLRESFDFGNDREGFDLLMKTMAALGGPGEIAVTMESTGHYHVLLWRFLASNGYAVDVKTPRSSPGSRPRRRSRGQKRTGGTPF